MLIRTPPRFKRVVTTLCVLSVAVTASGCGNAGSVASSAHSPAVSPAHGTPTTASESRLSTPTPTPSGTAIATCPAIVSNASGAYSLQCPAGWTYLNCEGTAFYPPSTWLINPTVICTQEAYGARVFVVSYPGAHDPPGSLGSPQSAKSVDVDSVSGTRKVYLVTASHPLPPPTDTIQVLYTFVTGGRTYYLEYDRFPGDADQTAAFDQMVSGTLKFSAATGGCTINSLPGLCIGRPATAEEEAAMIAVGVPAFEAYWGLKDSSVCATGDDCFWVGTPSRATIGVNAALFYGQEHVFSQGGGAGCWIFLYEDSPGWHFANGACAQATGSLPGLQDRVYVTGCANVRDAPGTSSKVLECLPNNTVVDVDSAPFYLDGHIWWHLAGLGWMAHDFLLRPKGVN
jgi:hypothetical protein